MTRISPTPSTTKKLFALSGNTCATPQCKNKLIEFNVILGEICHIEAAEENGPRYNSDSDDEYRRSFQNLILLCEKCHKIIDSDENSYPVTLLTSWKETHENKFKNSDFSISDELVEKSVRKFMQQKNDNTGSGTFINNQAEAQNITTQIATQNNYFGNEETVIDGNGYRPINQKLKKKIDKLKQKASPPTEDVVDFRNNLLDKKTSPIYSLPVKELKFRKENGRIKADVESHERIHGKIDENSEEGQKLLKEFLHRNDPEKAEILKQQIKHKGQLQPATVTCDGFLINGNRRKMAFEELYEEHHQDSRFENMRVAILPDEISIFDIRRIENRYQLQDEGKSEYHGLNRALTLRDNINNGYSLEAQIRDDPQYADKQGKELQKAVKDFEVKYLNPLKRVDEYLRTFEREGLYNTISEGAGDKEGRWQSFIDYSAFYYSVLDKPIKRQPLGIKENEVGLIENAIFKIIRKRRLDSRELEKSFGKVHAFVRSSNLKKYLQNPKAKKHFINIAKKVEDDIPDTEKIDKNGNKYSARDIDEYWGKKFRTEIIGELVQARKVINRKNERDMPLDLLEDALKKLNHKNLMIEHMGIEHYDKALSLTKEIAQKADEIFEQVDHARYDLQKLKRKGR